MWLKDYGINVGDTIRIRLNNIYRNKNGKLVANAITVTDNQEIQFNIKEDYASLEPGLYDLTCNNKATSGFPFVELREVTEFEQLDETNWMNQTVSDSHSTEWGKCYTWLKEEIQLTEQKLEMLKLIQEEWRRK